MTMTIEKRVKIWLGRGKQKANWICLLKALLIVRRSVHLSPTLCTLGAFVRRRLDRRDVESPR